MADVTVITPIGPYHLHLLDAIQSTVAAQTVACHHIIVVDRDGLGPAWARNTGLAQVKTPLVSFLDADDTLEPTFIEHCLGVYDGGHYIYTDWWQGDDRRDAPACPWVNSTWHCLTTLLPTAWAREAGGFDGDLPGAEDTDFYLKLTTSGRCGKRLPEALFHYGKGGRRAAAFVHGSEYAPVLKQFTERYGGKRMSCGDCGDSPNVDMPPVGDQLAGDVLAQAIWGGNRVERGRISGRSYPRTGNGKQVWVDPRDADASPHMFRRVELPLPPAIPVMSGPRTVDIIDAGAPVTELREVARAMFPGLQPPPPQPVEPVTVRPNVSKVRQLAQSGGQS